MVQLPPTINTITLQNASDRILAYQQKMDADVKEGRADANYAKCFTISGPEFLNIANIISGMQANNPTDNINAVRVYLGLKPGVTPGSLQTCLMLLPVCNFDAGSGNMGSDLIKTESIEPAATVPNYIWDYSLVCPPACPQGQCLPLGNP